MKEIAKHGDVETYKFHEKNGIRVDKEDGNSYYAQQRIIEAAAESGNLELFKWIMRDVAVDEIIWNTVVVKSAKHGRIMILDWLRENQNSNWSPYNAYEAALESGQIGILNWLKTHDYEYKQPDEKICKRAIINGKVDALEWALKNKIPISRNICALATQHNQLGVLQWCFQKKLTIWNPKVVLETARKEGKDEIEEWIQSVGF